MEVFAMREKGTMFSSIKSILKEMKSDGGRDSEKTSLVIPKGIERRWKRVTCWNHLPKMQQTDSKAGLSRRKDLFLRFARRCAASVLEMV